MRTSLRANDNYLRPISCANTIEKNYTKGSGQNQHGVLLSIMAVLLFGWASYARHFGCLSPVADTGRRRLLEYRQ
jgi:hypothetical protein